MQTIVPTILSLLLLSGWTNVTESPPSEKALIHLPFENSLSNIGSSSVQSKAFGGDVKYKIDQHKLALPPQKDGGWVEINTKSKVEHWQHGNALHSQGNGDWIEIKAESTISPAQTTEISFVFQREEWDNPYKKGSGAQTIAVLSGQGEKQREHLSFNFYPSKDLSFSVSFNDDEGKRHWLKTKRGAVTTKWHLVRLIIDQKTKETSLYFDEKIITKIKSLPVIMVNGIDSIKLGTWYKRNQAYRGLIDNFIIRNGKH